MSTPLRALRLARPLHAQAALARASSSAAASFQPPAATLEARLRAGLKAAMKARDRAAVAAHKAVLADAKYAAQAGTDPQAAPTDGLVVAALRKGIEKRAEAALVYAPEAPTAHADNHAALEAEIAVLRSYLPTPPTPAELASAVRAAVDALGPDERASRAALGTVVRRVWEALGERRASADKKEVVAAIQAALR